jgi:hypothetical protein
MSVLTPPEEANTFLGPFLPHQIAIITRKASRIILGAYPDTRGLSRPRGARSGSPESFSPGVDDLDSGAIGDEHIPGKTGE